MESQNEIKLLSLQEVLSELTCKKSLWYELIRQGAAPRPLKIGRKACWVGSEIEAFKRVLLARRNKEHGTFTAECSAQSDSQPLEIK